MEQAPSSFIWRSFDLHINYAKLIFSHSAHVQLSRIKTAGSIDNFFINTFYKSKVQFYVLYKSNYTILCPLHTLRSNNHHILYNSCRECFFTILGQSPFFFHFMHCTLYVHTSLLLLFWWLTSSKLAVVTALVVFSSKSVHWFSD